MEVHAFFGELTKKLNKYDEKAEFAGVVIQPMVKTKGYELLLGAKKDPQFGSVIVFGMGGTAAELYRDVSIGFPPLNQVLARRLLESTSIYKHASQVGLPLNTKLLEEIMVKFSQIVTDFPEIKEIDINPLVVSQESAVAVDARIVIDAERIEHEGGLHDHLAIAPYPSKYVTDWQLRDGTPVVLRPIKPEDEGRFSDLFKSLSPQTMRFRFFEIIKEMPHETLTRYCNLDYDREIAIVAEIQQSPRKIIGAARVILGPDGKSGEYAVLIGDDWQGLGLGSKLMEQIIEVAKDMRLESIFGYVIANNDKMLEMCSRLGARTQPMDEETVKVTFPLI